MLNRHTPALCKILLVCLLIGVPSAGAAQVQDADVARRAEAIVDLMTAGRFDEVYDDFDQKMREGLPAAKLAAGWTSIEQTVGSFERRTSVRTETRDGFDIAVVTCAFERGNVDVQVVFNGRAEIAGMFMRPAAPTAASGPPPYARPDAYTEQDVVAGAPDWPLPGTLTIPVGAGPYPVAVLVHGSGPQDRDATLGPNKPFRDLALGLASRGVAVLRYDKRSHQHASRMAEVSNVTVREEAIEDALAAVALVRDTDRIDPARVFILGHSLGGTIAPRIAAEAPDLAGVIVMAGAVKPLEQAIVEQTRYLLMSDGELTDAEREQLMEVERLAAEVRTLSPDDLEQNALVGGAPASYWLDLRGYNPPAAASQLSLPFLVLQGERDYQVTMDEFGRWKAALESRANVILRSYPSLNHLFMSGSGPSLPGEYLVPAHVDPAVIGDIADWIAARDR